MNALAIAGSGNFVPATVQSFIPQYEARLSGRFLIFVRSSTKDFVWPPARENSANSPWTYASETSTVPGAVSTAIAIQRTSEDLAPTMLATIKRLTGWTWDRLATILGKSRQALHGWTQGREITGANLERLAKLHATLIYLDRGSVEVNQAMLNTEAGDGRILIDLLESEDFAHARRLAGPGKGRAFRLANDIEVVAGEQVQHWFERLAGAPEIEPSLQLKRQRTPNRKLALRPRT